MGQPARPRYVGQLDGSRFAGLNCTPTAGSMGVDRATLGRKRTTGAHVRYLTGDTAGGTTLRQVAAAVKRGFDVDLDVQLGISFMTFEQRVHRGEGALLQGWEAVTRGTQWSASETFGGNHAWFVNEGRGWHQRADGLWLASDYLVYDPLADGRRDAIAQAPFWIPRGIVETWAGKLNVADPAEVARGQYVSLGIGRVYTAFTRDTEPHVHLTHGAHKTTPFPDHMVAKNPTAHSVAVRSGPGSSYARVDRIPNGTPFVAFQRADVGVGWYGNHDGDRWIASTRLVGEGGAS